MNLVDLYASTANCKIGKPYIFDKFYPLEKDKFITIHTTSKESKNYSFFQEVIDLIEPGLTAAGISIMQVGSQGEPPIAKATNLLGQTTLTQMAFVLKSGMLHLGIDSAAAHIAASYDKPLVILYGSANYLSCVSPYWGDRSKHRLIQCDMEGRKPIFSNTDPEKSIDRIKPEDVATAVMELLGLPFNKPYQTLFTGWASRLPSVECVLDQVINHASLNLDTLILRYDLLPDATYLFQQLQRSPCTIITDKPINLQALESHKGNLRGVIYRLDNNHDFAFAKAVQKMGIPLTLISDLSDEEIQRLKGEFFSLGIINKTEPLNPELMTRLRDEGELLYKSSKILLSSGKIYGSVADWRLGNTIDNFSSISKAPSDSEEFWKDVRSFKILKKL